MYLAYQLHREFSEKKRMHDSRSDPKVPNSHACDGVTRCGTIRQAVYRERDHVEEDGSADLGSESATPEQTHAADIAEDCAPSTVISRTGSSPHTTHHLDHRATGRGQDDAGSLCAHGCERARGAALYCVLSSCHGSHGHGVVEHREAESCLETLYRRRYFVERHDGTPVSYTYHPLLQDFLQHRLQQHWPTERLVALRTETVHFLSVAGQVEAAVDLSMHAQDHDAVARAIISHAPSLLRQGRFALIQRWLHALPPERRGTDPWPLYWSACATPPVNAVTLEQIRAGHEQAYRLFEARGELTGQVLAWAGVVKAIINSWDRLGRVDLWMEIGEVWLKDTSTDLPPSVRFEFLTAVLAVYSWRQLDSPLMPLAREELDRLLMSIDDPFALAEVYAHSAHIDLYGGTNHHAKNYFSARIRNRLGDNIPPLAQIVSDHAEGHAFWHRGDMERALAAADPIIELCHAQGIYFLIGWVLGLGAYPCLMLNCPQEAERYLAMVRPLYDQLPPLQRGYVHFIKAWHAYLVGDFLLAVRECEQADTLCDGAQCPLAEIDVRVARAMTCHTLGNDDEAHRHLASIEAEVQIAGGNMFGRCLWLLAKARLHLDAGRDRDGLMALREGLALASDTRQHYLPRWRPDEAARILVQALEEQIEPVFVRSLIKNLQIKPVGIARYSTAWPWTITIHTSCRSFFRSAPDISPVKTMLTNP